ncbi:hypothetical protein [Dactylosporangium sp. CA-233914]|uniref:hypothetical protein n=1 Tax=Dactylosporangium sp. CA-233914 TaxID=3239934 RepID=UPI003D8CD7EF
MTMSAEDLINAYVEDVTRLLPYKQQADVARELRALFREELGERDPGNSREETALRMLQEFGRPAEAAARYGRPVSVIDQADALSFLRWSVIGVVTIWLAGAIEAESILQWWLGVAIPALWWPGVLVFCYGLAAWTRRRWPSTAVWKPRRGADGRVNRPGRVAAILFFIAGTLTLVFAARLLDWVSGGKAAPEAIKALTFDDDFLRLRGPLTLLCMVLGIVLFAVVTVAGRWSPALRKAEMAGNVLTAAVYALILLGGPILQAEASDEVFRAALALTVAIGLIDAFMQARRLRRQTV